MTTDERIDDVRMAIWIELGGKDKAALERAARAAILATLQSLRPEIASLSEVRPGESEYAVGFEDGGIDQRERALFMIDQAIADLK